MQTSSRIILFTGQLIHVNVRRALVHQYMISTLLGILTYFDRPTLTDLMHLYFFFLWLNTLLFNEQRSQLVYFLVIQLIASFLTVMTNTCLFYWIPALYFVFLLYYSLCNTLPLARISLCFIVINMCYISTFVLYLILAHYLQLNMLPLHLQTKTGFLAINRFIQFFSCSNRAFRSGRKHLLCQQSEKVVSPTKFSNPSIVHCSSEISILDDISDRLDGVIFDSSVLCFPQPTVPVTLLDDTTDDFGGNGETDDDEASQHKLQSSRATTRSSCSSKQHTHYNNRKFIKTTAESEMKWLTLELCKYKNDEKDLDDEDSLDNRDTDKLVPMPISRSGSRNILASNMTGTGAAALSKNCLLALTGKGSTSCLANIVATPEEAEKILKNRDKPLKRNKLMKDDSDSELALKKCEPLPTSRSLEYMMATDELGEVIFTPYIGVGVASKHLKMPPLKVFRVGSKAVPPPGKIDRRVTSKYSTSNEKSHKHQVPISHDKQSSSSESSAIKVKGVQTLYKEEKIISIVPKLLGKVSSEDKVSSPSKQNGSEVHFHIESSNWSSPDNSVNQATSHPNMKTRSTYNLTSRHPPCKNISTKTSEASVSDWDDENDTCE